MKFFEELITSRQNRIVVDAVKLSDKKGRESVGMFRFDGVKLFEEAVKKGVVIKKILVNEGKLDRLYDRIKACEAELSEAVVYTISGELFEKISEENSPEGLICIAEYPHKHVRKATKSDFLDTASDKTNRVVLLESVRDPGNMGTIIRSAAAFGVDALAISSDCADIYNPKTVRGAMGALFKMNIYVFDDIKTAISALVDSGRKVYAAALDKTAVRLDEVELSRGDSVIIGNEGHGLSEETIEACTRSLYIPMEEGSESLNAAIAASVIMWNMYSK